MNQGLAFNSTNARAFLNQSETYSSFAGAEEFLFDLTQDTKYSPSDPEARLGLNFVGRVSEGSLDFEIRDFLAFVVPGRK